MRLLQVINSLATGGAEKLLLESIPIFIEKGVEVEILLLNGVAHPFLEELKSKNCCKIHSLGEGSVYNPYHIIKIIPFLKRFDLIHVHIFPSLYWVGLAKILSFSNVKLVYTEHSTTNNRRHNFWLKLLDQIIYRQYNQLIAITDQVRINLDLHLKSKLKKNRIQVIPNGVNLLQIQNSRPLKKTDFFIDDNIKIVIQVARFFYPKDPQTLIKSLVYLPNNIKLILVGDGILKEESQRLVTHLNLQERVVFLGVRTDVYSLLKTADVIVLSSKYEGLSLSCIEGMASGKPFVASDVVGLKEVVGNAGLLFPFGDEKALAKTLQLLLSNDQLYSETVANCLRRAGEYDINLMVERYIQCYNKL